MGKVSQAHDAIDYHIDAIMDYKYVDCASIAKWVFVAVDCINSTGAPFLFLHLMHWE